MPVRIQRLRTAGWRMPIGALYVGRPTPWGNPFPFAHGPDGLFPRDDAIRMHRELILTGETSFAYGDTEHHFARSERRGPLYVPTIDIIRRELAGRDLACWCPLVDRDGNPVACHADTLLEIANGSQS